MVVMGVYVRFWWVQACGAAGSPGLCGCSFIRFCQQFSRATIALHSGIQPTALCQVCIVPFFRVKQRGIQILPLLLLIVPLDKLGNLTKA